MPDPYPKTGRRRTPILFLIALITMWLLGMHAVTEGVRAIDIVHSPVSQSLASYDGNDVGDAAQRAFVEGVSQHFSVTLPLGVAQLILGTLLAFISIRTLFGRRGSRSFALQVLTANALLTLVGYLLHDPVRRAVMEAVVAQVATERPPEIGRVQFEALARTNLRWGFRFWLAAQLLGFGFAGYALTRAAARDLFGSADPGAKQGN